MRMLVNCKWLWFCLLQVLLLCSTAGAQPAEGANKFLGNITTRGQVRSDYLTYWNQITGENEHKWSSVEGTRDQMNWGGGDAIADFANENGIPWKFHTLIWGSQYPTWIEELSQSEQLAEIEEWMDAAAARYPDVQMIDVVNEATPSHAPPPFKDALGGDGSTGVDYIIEAFRMARERWPNAILIYNDYNNLEWDNDVQWTYDLANTMLEAGAPIDAIGCQAHGAYDRPTSTVMDNLDKLASTGLPIFISEYDIAESDDDTQLSVMQDQFPKFWNHPSVVGITYWGYIVGSTWVEGTGLKHSDGAHRPALDWLIEYVEDNPNPPNDFPNFLSSGSSGYSLTVNTTGEGTVSRDPSSTRYEEGTSVTLTAEPAEGWEFSTWSGEGISSSEYSVDITMDSDKTLSALFSRSPDEEGNYVINGDFSSDDDNWTLNVWEGDASGSVVDGEYQISIGSTGSESHQIQLVQPGIYLENGETYQVSFDAYASAARELDVNVEMAEDPWDSYLSELEYFDLTTENQSFTFSFTMNAETDVNGRLSFNAGSTTEDVYIDNVSIKEYSTSTVSSKSLRQMKEMKVTSSNSSIRVEFVSNRKSMVDIRVYNLRGKLVKRASAGTESNGIVSHLFDLKDMSDGVYVVKAFSKGKMLNMSKAVVTVE